MNMKPKEKRNYCMPEIVYIEIDNEISLTLESEPPIFENETLNSTTNGFNNNPFKMNIS